MIKFSFSKNFQCQLINCFNNNLKVESDSFKNRFKSKPIYPIDYRYFHYQIGMQMGGVKFANIGLNTQIYFQPMRYFCINGGLDIQNFRLKVFSSSDKHIINTGAMPIYFGGLINLKNHHKSSKAYYVFGKKGIAVGLASENGTANNHQYLELGLGKTFKGMESNISYRLEASYQEFGLSGTAIGSYQSFIEYNLKYRSVLLRAAVVLHNN